MNIGNEKPAAEGCGLVSDYRSHNNILSIQKQHEYEQEFITAMQEAGIICLEPIIPDGKIHRFAPGGEGDDDGWYVFYGMAGAYGDWSQNVKCKWSFKRKGLSKAERSQLANQIQ